MPETFTPILCPVKGNPDISISFSDGSRSEFNVFFGLALLEKVSAQKDRPEFKMLLGRLHNMKLSGRELAKRFEVSRSTIARWGRALKSGDMKKMEVAFSGQGAKRKLDDRMIAFIKDRYRALHRSERNYNQLIRAEVRKYHGVSISSEAARKIFSEVRKETNASSDGSAPGFQDQPDPLSTLEQPNPCESLAHSPANGEVLEGSRNLSDHLVGERAWFREIPEDTPVYNHHAGLALLHPWIEQVVSQTRTALDRQTICQILLGALNHEQAKELNFSSLKDLIGPALQSLHYQRSRMDLLATPENTFRLQAHNTRLFQTEENDWFYFDPHSPKYTGALPLLKGWCGSTHQVEKITNMDFVHDAQGNPCYVEHADNYYEMRHRFFTCAANFHRTQDDPNRSLCWVVDRGIYSLETLRRIRESGDEIITWEKNYKRNGFNANAPVGTTTFSIPRNNAQDLRLYRFEYQETAWERDATFRKIIVKATNPNHKTIEVSILCSDQNISVEKIIFALFRRWVQENDFGYMDRHVGINEMTSRAHRNYNELAGELADRPVASRDYKAKKKEKTNLEGKLKTNLLKRKKTVRAHTEKKRAENTEIEAVKKSIAQLKSRTSSKKNDPALKTAQAKQARLEKKRDKNKATRARAAKKLRTNIQEQNRGLDKIDQALDTLYRTESRLGILTGQNHVRLDYRRKAYMDALRIISRNIFYKLAREFRPEYNNHRDDHVIVRHLTRCAGLIRKRGETIEITLIPSMEFSPQKREIIVRFLSETSRKIPELHPRSIPEIKIGLYDKKTDGLKFPI